MPALPQLQEAHPRLTLEIATDIATVNLHRRDADIALRMIKPDRGHVTVQRLGTLGFGLYAADRYLEARGQRGYVDLEHDIANAIPRYGKTKRIISYHNFQETPEDIAVLPDNKHLLLGHFGGMHDGLWVVTVDVKNRCIDHLGHIRWVNR